MSIHFHPFPSLVFLSTRPAPRLGPSRWKLPPFDPQPFHAKRDVGKGTTMQRLALVALALVQAVGADGMGCWLGMRVFAGKLSSYFNL